MVGSGERGSIAFRLGARIGDPLSSTAGGRLSAILFVLCGALVASAAVLPRPEAASSVGLVLVGVAAVAVGVVLWVLPWERWRPYASLVVCVPPAFVLISFHNHVTGLDGYRYGLFYLVLFAWVGLAHPPGTSFRLAPLLVLAYMEPMLSRGQAVDGSALSALAYTAPISVLVGETTAYVAGRLRTSEAAMRRSEARWRSLVVNASDLVIVIGPDGIIQYATPAVERLFGYSEQQATGMQVLDLIHPDDIAFVLERLELAVARPGVGEHIEFRVAKADGNYIWVDSIGTNLLADEAVGGIVCNVRDISERKATERILVHQARHDSLTGLPNRLELIEELGRQAARGGSPFSLFLLDLDRFKEINDALGHETGDRLLVEVAHRLEDVAPLDGFVARLGGDEFAVIAPRVAGEPAAGALAAGLRHALDAPFELDAMSLHVGASVGIALGDTSGPDEVDVMVLLQQADVAMYRAKETGTGWAIFGPDDVQNRPARLAMVGRLRAALDSGDLRVSYQPQLELATGLVTQVEALARWEVDGVPVPPARFIPLAEQTGLIGRLTVAVLEQSLVQGRCWAEAGLPLSVAVNISASSLRTTEVVGWVRNALAASGLAPASLTLEITESAFAGDTGTVLRILHELRELGVRLSIDDFGAGYSSMAYLKRLPVDELKIDRAFVTDLLGDPRDQSITRAITDVAHSLDLTVVAEGVESAAVQARLQALGCDLAQGYGICRPVTAGELEQWLRRAEGVVATA